MHLDRDFYYNTDYDLLMQTLMDKFVSYFNYVGWYLKLRTKQSIFLIQSVVQVMIVTYVYVRLPHINLYHSIHDI